MTNAETYSVTPVAGTTDVLVINRSDLGSDTPNSEWRISGTDLAGYQYMYFNYYSGLTGTVRQGSGANFDITTDGSGGYSVVIGTSGGINYLEGHKIKVLGTSLGGDTPANDAIITVTGATSGVISNASISGTSYGSAGYPARTGTNYQTGSGLIFDFEGPLGSNDYSQWENITIAAGGTNYAEGDIVVFAGTSLGGTTPANDLTLRVSANNGVVIGLYDITGTGQNTTYRIEVTGSGVNFGAAGSWTLSYSTGGEAFVWTPSWNKTVGSLNPNLTKDTFQWQWAVTTLFMLRVKSMPMTAPATSTLWSASLTT
jgi:hypothetical protein